MMEFTFKKAEVKQCLDGNFEISLTVPKDEKFAVVKVFDSMKEGVDMVAKIVEKRKKRSLDANAYAWVLMNKIAVEMSKEYIITPLEVYRTLIPDVGDNFEIVPVKKEALSKWIHNWENEPPTKMGWVVNVLGEAKNFPGYVNTINYYGSSTYDSRQMARLIDLILDICRDYRIDTMPPHEVERLKAEWGKKNE